MTKSISRPDTEEIATIDPLVFSRCGSAAVHTRTVCIRSVWKLACQYAVAGVRANCVSPGNTYFPGGFWEGVEANNPELFAAAIGHNPTGRMASAEEVAYAVVMLASPRASRITGTNLVVDGALTRGVQL